MINNLTSSSTHLVTSSFSTPYVGNNGQSAGNVRFNTTLQQMEVFDGSMWQAISQNVTVGLSWDADNAIRWAQEKMSEEIELKKLAEENAAVRIALENVKKAQEQLKITANLAKEPA